MVPIITLTFVIGFSMLITKIATIALMQTGLTRERAKFQARSAFSGAGFTTSESEVVVKHPVRRRIITLLIITGNAGIVTAISTLILGFVGPESQAGQLVNIALLFVGLTLLFLAARSQRLDRVLSGVIQAMLRRYTDIPKNSVSRLMTLMEDYEITEVSVEKGSWMADHTLAELDLPEEGVLVLGIVKDDGAYLGVPRGRYRLEEGDEVILYGKSDRVGDLGKRRESGTGESDREQGVREHQEEMEEQDRKVEQAKEEN